MKNTMAIERERADLRSKGLFVRILICILGFGFCLYSYVDKQNDLTRLRLEIPHMAKAVKDIREENTRLAYQIELFEDPQHLMELARGREFRHLKQPLVKEIVTVQEGLALGSPSDEKTEVSQTRPKVTLAIGAKH